MVENETVPRVRITAITNNAVRDSGEYVLYWMTAMRRLRYNFGLQRAVQWANELQRPLLIFDAVRTNYRWACDRFHQFLIDGITERSSQLSSSRAAHCAYIEPNAHHGAGLMETLAKHACVVVADDYPCFFHPALYRKIAAEWGCALEIVDSNTILPMRLPDRTFTVAHSYRRYMQKVVAESMPQFPVEEPLKALKTERLKTLPVGIKKKWGCGLAGEGLSLCTDLSKLPIDHSVKPTENGQESEARKVLSRFLKSRLSKYEHDRNEPELQGSSWLSPHLHFGTMSSFEVFFEVSKAEDWAPKKLSKPNGKMNGFWNMSVDAEAFIDQLMTWREIGFNMCVREPKFDRYESLPDWAQKTLAEHAEDPRQHAYSLEDFELARTHDDLWNAAQNQLVHEGRIHNYLRMLWGKKILHWSATPQQALKTMIHLNNKYALDGRDPNSYSGIFWVLGRYDRAWGPERPIFGKIRYMTSESTRSKFSVKNYIRKYNQVVP
ncbi:MAG: deoxyribodipyrimidine photolyase [Pirellula sp.]|jgi:deoxyribodipyrimidine photo-lyase